MGASLGYSLAVAGSGKRVLAFIGDGSFQMTAQEVSTMLRYQQAPIIVLINNQGYTIEGACAHASSATMMRWPLLIVNRHAPHT